MVKSSELIKVIYEFVLDLGLRKGKKYLIIIGQKL